MIGFGALAGDEAGAVTVDWVALTMGVLFAGIIAIYAIFGNGVKQLVAETNDIVLVATDVDPGPAPAIGK